MASLGSKFTNINPEYPYCVYKHSNNDGIFYVGFGSLKRAFAFDNRYKSWRNEYAKGNITVEIDSVFKTDREGKDRELELILELKPIANYIYKGSVRLKQDNMVSIKCNETGEVFDSICSAAKRYEVSPCTIVRHIGKRTDRYAKKIKGLSFSKIS